MTTVKMRKRRREGGGREDIGMKDAPLHQTQKRRIHRVWYLKLIRVLAQEQHTVVDELAYHEPEDLPEVATRDEFLDVHKR